MTEQNNTPTINTRMSRRDVLKLGGVIGLGAGLTGVAGAGWIQGKSVDTYSGWESHEGKTYFNRGPFQVEKPNYKVFRSEITRIEGLDAPSDRHNLIKQLGLDKKDGLLQASGPLKDYYVRNPDKFTKDKIIIEEINPRRKEVEKKIGKKFALAHAWDQSWVAVKPGIPQKPEVSDWEGVRKPAYKLKSPQKTAELIKKMAQSFGAPLVGITKLNPAWVYATAAGSRGYKAGEPISIPEWWEFAIVIGVPHEWDAMLANPTYGGEDDAISRSNIAAARLAHFIKSLGYPARIHGGSSLRSEVVMPPLMVDAGLGEQGRLSLVVTPEFGPNIRPAVITTNIPMQPDKPIDLKMKEFCRHCKLCAEICPSKAISFDDYPQNIRGRGVEGWCIDLESCLSYRQSVPSTQRCRLCITACPWSRKGNWVHNVTKQIIPRDSTGVVAKSLTWAQKTFYEFPEASRFADPAWGSYRQAPWYFRAEDFLEL